VLAIAEFCRRSDIGVLRLRTVATKDRPVTIQQKVHADDAALR